VIIHEKDEYVPIYLPTVLKKNIYTNDNVGIDYLLTVLKKNIYMIM